MNILVLVIIVLLYTSSFSITYVSIREVAIVDQARKSIPQGLLTNFDPISDNKE